MPIGGRCDQKTESEGTVPLVHEALAGVDVGRGRAGRLRRQTGARNGRCAQAEKLTTIEYEHECSLAERADPEQGQAVFGAIRTVGLSGSLISKATSQSRWNDRICALPSRNRSA